MLHSKESLFGSGKTFTAIKQASPAALFFQFWGMEPMSGVEPLTY